MNAHRFSQTINGRPYVIEVTRVARDRWRAQIARLPGAMTALMPFYGPTPVEAAAELTQWLTRQVTGAPGVRSCDEVRPAAVPHRKI